MPLDGIVIRNVVHELNALTQGGRIDKIYQLDKDEIVFSVRSLGKNVRILLTSNADFPRMHITESRFENPQSPPMFCMTLRKHLAGAKIIGFSQPQLERIIELRAATHNELGDAVEIRLVLEIMGKHSNIILVGAEDKIIDSARRISFERSSVREVLPGKAYVYPPSQDKRNPLLLTQEEFLQTLRLQPGAKAVSAIYQNYCGISPMIATEICEAAGVAPSDFVESIDPARRAALFSAFQNLMAECAADRYRPQIVYDGNRVVEFSSLELHQFGTMRKQYFDSISALLEVYYGERAVFHRLKQKTADLRKLVQSNIERCVKKADILEKTFKDTESMDQWRIKGELLTSYMSFVTPGAKFYDAENYYEDNKICRIALKEDLTPSQNAKRYFDKYNKAKRQRTAVLEQLAQNKEELAYLEGVSTIIFSSGLTENEIQEVKEELYQGGYLKKNPTRKGIRQKKSEPMHFQASDGTDIFVGKNNRQNDELTLKFAGPRDIWLHTKEIPGSHVILKTTGLEPPSDDALRAAAMLAAYYSKGRDSSSVPVDYAERRNVKKPSGAKPGMVIYEKNRTLFVTPDAELIAGIRQIN